jgi:hypothetical protein
MDSETDLLTSILTSLKFRCFNHKNELDSIVQLYWSIVARPAMRAIYSAMLALFIDGIM